MKSTAVLVLMFVVSIVTNGLAHIFIKAGTTSINNRHQGGVPEGLAPLLSAFLLNWRIVLGLFLFAVSLAIYNLILARPTPLSIAYPVMTTLSFILVVSGGMAFFNESHLLREWQTWVGIVLIIGGVWLLASRLS